MVGILVHGDNHFIVRGQYRRQHREWRSHGLAYAA
jgi:hypothetical protein